MALQFEHVIDGEVIGPGSGGAFNGRTSPRSVTAQSTVTPAQRKARPIQHSVYDNRRGLLLTREQLSGPPAPDFLMRPPYVYGSQGLL